MAKNIAPELRKIGEYLTLENDSKFVIPDYQRPYSWGVENCDKLWQDIVSFSENKSKDNYFFGTIIISCQDNDKRYELIDGQQRTTTFLLLFKALLLGVNNSISRISDEDEDSIRLLRELRSRRKKLLEILYRAEEADIADRPNDKMDAQIYNTFDLLLNESNNEFYKSELSIILKAKDFQDAERNVEKIPYKQKDNKYTNFFRNFKHFYEIILKLHGSEINRIAKSVVESCEVIEIKSWEEEQAIRMFNSLNSDGMPLNDADIISAKLLAHAKNLNKAQEFKDIWKNLRDKLKESQISESVNIDSILTQYMYLTRAKKGEMVTDTTVPGVRRYYTSINENLIKNPIKTCSDMLKLAEAWDTTYNYPIVRILLKCNENAKLFLGCYFNRFLNNEKIDENKVTLLAETMLRLFVVLELVDAGYSSTHFKTFLFKESIKLTDADISINEIVADFNTHISKNWNNRDDIKTLVSDYNKNLLVYVNEYLFAKENDAEFKLDAKQDIEHIMPASGHNLELIRKDAGLMNESEFDSVVNKLGNKILLEYKINRSIGNEWFRTKVSNSITNKLGYVNSVYPIASHLVEVYKNVDKPYWNKEDINNATDEAADRIVNFIFN